VTEVLDTKIYELVGELYKRGFDGDRYDRILTSQNDWNCAHSAITGKCDLLMTGGIGAGSTKKSEAHCSGPGVGTILEVKRRRVWARL
jgi:translation initiation factor 5B